MPTDDAVTRLRTNAPEKPQTEDETLGQRDMSQGAMYDGVTGLPLESSQPGWRPPIGPQMEVPGAPMQAVIPALRDMNPRIPLPPISYKSDSDHSPTLTYSNPPQPQPEVTKLNLPSSVMPISDPDAPPLRGMSHGVVMPTILYDEYEPDVDDESDEDEDTTTESGLSMRYNMDELRKSKASKSQAVQNATSVTKVLNSASVSKAVTVSIENDESLRRLAAMTEWKERRIQKRAAETISRTVQGSWYHKRFRLFRHAVMKLQASFRRKKDRAYFLKLREVVKSVQKRVRVINKARWRRNARTLSKRVLKAWRRYRARRCLHWFITTVHVTAANKKRRRIRAAAKIQRRFRFHMAVCALFRLIAARRIQRHVRQWIQRRRMRELNAANLIIKNYRKYAEKCRFLLKREIPILEASRRAQVAFDKATSIKSEMGSQFLTNKAFPVIFFGLVLMACNSVYIASRIGTDSEIKSRLRLVDAAYFSKLRGGVNWWITPQAMDSFYPSSFPRNAYEHITSETGDSVLWNKNLGVCASKGRDLNGRIGTDGFDCLRELRSEWLPSLSSLLPDPRSEVAMALCLNRPSLPAPSSNIIRGLFLMDKEYGILPSWRLFRNLNAYQVFSALSFLVTAAGLSATVYMKRRAPLKEDKGMSIGHAKRLFEKSLYEFDQVTQVGVGCAALSFVVTSLLGISTVRLVYFWLSDSLSENNCDYKLPFPPPLTILTRLYEPRTEHRFAIDKAVFPLELNELFMDVILAGVFGFILIEWQRHCKNCLVLKDKFYAQIDKLTMECYGMKM
jgi:hypothetical protein